MIDNKIYNQTTNTKKIVSHNVTAAEKWEKFCFSLGIFRVFQCFNVFFCALNNKFLPCSAAYFTRRIETINKYKEVKK